MYVQNIFSTVPRHIFIESYWFPGFQLFVVSLFDMFGFESYCLLLRMKKNW